MLKRSLNRTNPYLVDPAKRHAMFQMTVYTSTDIEGVKLTQSDLLLKRELFAALLPVNLQSPLDHRDK